MASLSFSSTSAHTFSLHCNSKLSAFSQSKPALLFNRAPYTQTSGSLRYNPLRSLVGNEGKLVMKTKRKSMGLSAVCYAAPLTVRNLQWISTISSAVLLLAKGTAVQKSFIVPLIALQAPTSIITWMKGEYGTWAAFLALLVRLFFFIPGRGTQQGAIISLVIAGYMAFQHFSRAGSLQKAFDQGSIVATLAIICLTVVSCFLLI
ncbi:hypothetical protein FEM48_Zijuj01G0058200 [Ziziphus jujuba var. spinosa]|uniref:Cold-regulated 413 inner membrane protein 1, chloroplastic-like n=1 Tax=Ziziphus jujuba var. spinosa TaxID=714518 RepID=A0A978VZH4_ZIZJJ|nr:hypothetical protein FEM48_Zijuj01G0058200 [Ziziphus jujuba var. spinosa]